MKQVLSSHVLAAALAVSAAIFVVSFANSAPNADLIAAWFAGQHFRLGLHDHVYPDYGDAFTLHPHSSWPSFAEAEGYRGPVFPFIYPPIWAWVMTHIETIEGFRAFAQIALLANAAMLMGTVWLAMRAAGSGLPPVLYIAGGALLLGTSHVGIIPLLQGQPQILVGFLIVLAIERSRAGHGTAAGAALALAAALKLYPALFALIWLVSGERRALTAFAIFGAGLAALSIALTGWDLHAAFIADMQAVSNTVLVTGMTTNVQTIVAQFAFPNDLILVRPIEVGSTPPPDAAWYYLATGPLFDVASKGALAAVMAAIFWAANNTGPDERAEFVWPIALAAVPLLLPISWSYYFIPALAFLPGICWRLGPVWGPLAFAAILAPITVPMMRVFGELQQLVVTLPFIALLAAQMTAALWHRGNLRPSHSEVNSGLSNAGQYRGSH